MNISSLIYKLKIQNVPSTGVNIPDNRIEYFIKHITVLYCDITEALTECLKLEGDQKKNFISRCIWDLAHRLEKAEEHARSEAIVVDKFITNVYDMISECSIHD